MFSRKYDSAIGKIKMSFFQCPIAFYGIKCNFHYI